MLSTVLLVIFLLIAVLLAFQMFTESTAITSLVANLLFRRNFHEVDPGKLYRAGKMPEEVAKKTIEKFGIKTVIDLRLGFGVPGGIAHNEAEYIERLGVKHFHLKWRGSRMIAREDLLTLLEVYDTAEKPILVHCASGTHRSGVAAALWLLHQNKDNEKAAAEQLSFQYGYVGWERRLKTLFSGHRTVDNILWDYLDVPTPRPSLKDWIATQYCAE